MHIDNIIQINYLIIKSFFLWICSVIFFRVALDSTYVFWLVGSGVYGDGFDYDLSFVRQLEALVALILASMLMPVRSEHLTDFLSVLLFLLCIVPSASYYSWAGGSRVWFWALILQFLIFRVLTSVPKFTKIERKIPLPAKNSYATFVACMLIGVVLCKLWGSGFFDTFSLSLGDIYQRRQVAYENIDHKIWAYIFSWVTKVCVVYIFVISLVKKNIGLLFFSLSCTFLMFGVFAHKSLLMSFFAAALVFYSFRYWRNRMFIIPLVGGAAIFLIAFLSEASQFYLYQDILVRRLFYTPAKLNFIYYEFFKNLDPLYFSNGFLRSFVDYPFDRQYTFIVGEFSGMGGEGTAANNGFLATGYMQLGWCGVILYPCVAAVLARLLGALGRNSSTKAVAAICFYPFAALFTSSDLPTAILTHGIGFMLLMVWLSPIEDPSSQVDGAGGK